MSRDPMKPEHRKARLIRALSGLTQEQMSEKTGISAAMIDHFEQGRVVPDDDQLERMAACAGITGADADEGLRLYETQRRTWLRRSEGVRAILGRLGKKLLRHSSDTGKRLLKLPLPGRQPSEADRRRIEESWAQLRRLSRRSRLAVVRVSERCQNWALAERCCEESIRQASRNLKAAAAWAQLALAIASQVRGTEGWRHRIRALALAHWANILRIRGKLQEAEVRMEEAKRLWATGSDPAAVLDPGRLLDLEGSLRRDQRRFEEALALFDRAAAVGRSPERAWMKKGTTYEVMGEHEQAVTAYLVAKAEVERRGDPRLAYMLRLNLAASYCHLGQHARAADLVERVRELVAVRGDKIEEIRVIWLEGRILAGLDRHGEALAHLAEARRRFAKEEMSYDVALALLEEAALLLEEGRTAEVKALALDLTEVFESKGVHREALAALKLFQEAAEREAATAELARRVLRFLFRARHDQDLQFES